MMFFRKKGVDQNKKLDTNIDSYLSRGALVKYCHGESVVKALLDRQCAEEEFSL